MEKQILNSNFSIEKFSNEHGISEIFNYVKFILVMASLQITTSKFHELNENIINHNVPEKSGIYLLKIQLLNGSWRYFYIGKADNLKMSLLGHLSNKENNEFIRSKLLKYVCGFEYTEI